MSIIKSIHAQEILDSRGNPTIETTIALDNGKEVIASVPSGASTSSFESYELRDEDPNRYEGKGVLKACKVVNETLSKIVIGRVPTDQFKIDSEMIALDATPNKSRLGGNSILSVSECVCKAGASDQDLKVWKYIQQFTSAKLSMPTPTYNIINGGKHGGGNLNIQEFHIVPRTSEKYSSALEIGQEVYESLKELLIAKNYIHSTGDEGGFAPNLSTNSEALDLIVEAIKQTNLTPFEDIFLGIDVSASNIYKNGKYFLIDKSLPLSSEQMINYLSQLKEIYHLLFIEDGLFEDDWNSWKDLTKNLNQTMIVGDDFLATNLKRLKKAIDEKAANTILVKPNQAGTITETLEIIKLAKENNWETIVSHRSGETNDSFIADLAVGVGSEYVKFGAPARGEHIAKYNRLLEIERELNIDAQSK